ncbi:GNAT family N-acetyltransferase [Streptomyces sp. QTS137]
MHPTSAPVTPVRPTAGPLTLRPWSPKDSAGLAELYRDEALRRWTGDAVRDGASAARWVSAQQRGWEAGDRLAFAVEETPAGPGARGTPARLVGNVVLKYAARGSGSAEVGYWTGAPARGRGVAPRALAVLTGWASTAFAHEGLTRLELLHQVDNEASCRVAGKAGSTLTTVLPAAPPAFPRDGHVHVRHAPTAA